MPRSIECVMLMISYDRTFDEAYRKCKSDIYRVTYDTVPSAVDIYVFDRRIELQCGNMTFEV